MPQDRGYKRKHRGADEGLKGPQRAAADATATRPQSSPQDEVRAVARRTFKPSKLLVQAALMNAGEDSTKRARDTRKLIGGSE